MKPQELRIGNRILGVYIDEDENGEEIEVVCECIVGTLDILDQTEYSIWVTGGAEREYYDEFRPIPLTEEQLLRFGFERGVDFWSKDGVVLDITPNGLELRLPQYFGVTPPIVIESVHRLQNLYHAYTMKELPTPVLLR